MYRFVCIRDVTAFRATPKAIWCWQAGKQFWIPVSQIHSDSDVRRPGDSGTLVIPFWLAEAKDLAPSGDYDYRSFRAAYNQRGDSTPARIELNQTNSVFRSLAREFHPDVNPNGAPTMRALNQLMDAVRADVARVEHAQ